MKDNKYYNGAMYPKQLNTEVQLDMINRYYKNGDKNARKILIEHNVRLVIHIINKRFCNSNIDIEELFSIGVIGLIKGVDSFDPNKGFLFATYVSRCIINEILMAFRKEGKVGKTVSFDDCISTDNVGNELYLRDVIKDDENLPEDNYNDKETYDEIKKIIDSLPEKDRQIITMYFGFGGRRYTQKQIAEQLELSQSYISRIIKRNIEKIGIKLKIKIFDYKPKNEQIGSTDTNSNNTKTSMQIVDNTKPSNDLIKFVLKQSIKYMNTKTAKLMDLKYKYGISDNKKLAFLLNVDEKKINKILVEALNVIKNTYLETLSNSRRVYNGNAYVKK